MQIDKWQQRTITGTHAAKGVQETWSDKWLAASTHCLPSSWTLLSEQLIFTCFRLLYVRKHPSAIATLLFTASRFKCQTSLPSVTPLPSAITTPFTALELKHRSNSARSGLSALLFPSPDSIMKRIFYFPKLRGRKLGFRNKQIQIF